MKKKARAIRLYRCRLAFVTISALLAILAVAAVVQAQSGGGFNLTWNTIDGGGTLSTGGVYRLNGTIGQPDAQLTLAGGGFTLTGGFWSGIPGVSLYLPVIMR